MRPEIAAKIKIAYHFEKIEKYLKGENIFPVTLELDITASCTRRCPDCPSTRAQVGMNLEMDFIERLFTALQGQTRGLLLTGGEPTMAPLFHRVVKQARLFGFQEIAVVTNGSFLDRPAVSRALLDHVTTIRLSLYDWEKGGCTRFEQNLKNIEALRKQIDSSKSPLQIGISILTSKERKKYLGDLAAAVSAAGAHWLYFHPLCFGWNDGGPVQAEQNGVPAEIRRLQRQYGDKLDIFISPERYTNDKIEFSVYHAAHFLMVVGADKKNYLGAEVKYQPGSVIADFSSGLAADFLWKQARLDFISKTSSLAYRALASRHRGVLYNDLLEKIKRGGFDCKLLKESSTFRFPHIL